MPEPVDGHWTFSPDAVARVIQLRLPSLADEWLDERRTQVELFPTRLAEGAHLQTRSVDLSCQFSVGRQLTRLLNMVPL